MCGWGTVAGAEDVVVAIGREGETDLRPEGGRRIELWRGGGRRTGLAGTEAGGGGAGLRGGSGGSFEFEGVVSCRGTNGLCGVWTGADFAKGLVEWSNDRVDEAGVGSESCPLSGDLG